MRTRRGLGVLRFNNAWRGDGVFFVIDLFLYGLAGVLTAIGCFTY